MGKLALALFALLVIVSALTTGVGVYALLGDYRTLRQQHVADTRDALRNATVLISNQLAFYQALVQQLANNPDIADMLEFGAPDEMMAWSEQIRTLLPGILGAALVSHHGKVHGDPFSQRVGPACIADMERISKGAPLQSPPLHVEVEGFQHFDLLTRVHGHSGDSSGIIFVSFRLEIIESMFTQIAAKGDHFELLGEDGETKLVVGKLDPSVPATVQHRPIPNTAWTLRLTRPAAPTLGSIPWLIAVNGLILLLSGVAIAVVIRATTGCLRADLGRVQAALQSVLADCYECNRAPTSLRETETILPQIEQLALALQQQRNELRRQSLSDPLTGLANRRHFDTMLAHVHEQSQRQPPAYLLLIDLDQFKQVNDQFGHRAGDQVLIELAQFLSSNVRSSDIVARVGGDEFAVILTHMSRHGIDAWLQALVRAFDAANAEKAARNAAFSTLSIGAAAIDATEFEQPSGAYQAADATLYTVKRRRNSGSSQFALARSQGERGA